MRDPLDPFSKAMNDQNRWDPEWYSWLQELAKSTTRLETAVPPETDLSEIETDIATLQAQVATLQATSPPGLVFLQRQVVTTPVSAIDFTGMDGAYDVYLFEGANLSVDLDGAAIFLRASLNNGASFDTSAVYYQDLIYHYWSSGDSHAIAASVTSSTFFQITHGQGGPVSVAQPFDFSLKVYGANIGARYATIMSDSYNYHNTANAMMTLINKGTYFGGGGLNAVRFLDNSGNIVTGSITMYGMRKT